MQKFFLQTGSDFVTGGLVTRILLEDLYMVDVIVQSQVRLGEPKLINDSLICN